MTKTSPAMSEKFQKMVTRRNLMVGGATVAVAGVGALSLTKGSSGHPLFGEVNPQDATELGDG
ncbi:MAG: hypothetical protein AAF723_08490, partial [Pseudomonadota bacterium]